MYTLVTANTHQKQNDKAVKCVLFGDNETVKGYQVYNPWPIKLGLPSMFIFTVLWPKGWELNLDGNGSHISDFIPKKAP